MNEDIFHLGIKAIIRNPEGKILLLRVNLEKLTIKNKGAYWDIPGGRIHKGSTIEETLKREIQEETGILEVYSFNKLDMVLSNIRIPQVDGSFGLILGIYVCDVGNIDKIIISDEHTEYGWFNPQEVAGLLQVKYPPEFCEKISNWQKRVLPESGSTRYFVVSKVYNANRILCCHDSIIISQPQRLVLLEVSNVF